MKQILIIAIQLYQKTLSPDHGWFKARFPYGYCRFYPTCSQYGIDSIRTHGAVTGIYLTIKRIIKCNPFHAPGVDAVAKK